MSRLAANAGSGQVVRAVAALCVGVCTTSCSLFDNLDHFKHADAKRRSSPDASKAADAAPSGDSGTDGGAKSDSGAKIDGGKATGTSGPSGCESAQTLCLRIKGFAPHIDQLVGVDLVSADSILRARAVLDPLAANGGADADIVLPLAIPASEVPAAGEKHPLHLEIFGDANNDGKYTPDGMDHDWKVDLPADGKLVFSHNSQFTRLLPRPASIGGDFHMRFKGMMVHIGKRLEVMVIEQDSGRAVGMYRMQSIPGDQFEIQIPGIIDVGGVVYRIEFYADANGNLDYDDPPADHTWLLTGESNNQGADFEFTHGTNFIPLEYQFTFTP